MANGVATIAQHAHHKYDCNDNDGDDEQVSYDRINGMNLFSNLVNICKHVFLIGLKKQRYELQQKFGSSVSLGL